MACSTLKAFREVIEFNCMILVHNDETLLLRQFFCLRFFVSRYQIFSSWTFGDQDASHWPDANAIYYSDATIYLEHDIMVLATENKLTNDLVLEGDLDEENSNIQSLQKTQCSIELYYSIHEL